MDMLPTSVISVVELSLQALIVISAVVIFAFNYFQVKEARKMERKLNMFLPGSVGLAMSLQTTASIAFLVLAAAFLLFV